MTIKEQLQQKANADGKAYGYVTISSGKNDTLMCSKYKDGTFHEFDVTWAEYFRDEYGDNWKSETTHYICGKPAIPLHSAQSSRLW